MVLQYLNMKMKFLYRTGFILFLLCTATYASAAAVTGVSAGAEPVQSSVKADAGANSAEDDAWNEEKWDNEWEASDAIADPLEPLNRLFFHFNDKFYYWVLKPVANVYASVIGEDLQICIRNVFDNLRTPVKAVNSLLQGNVPDSAKEVARFALNSTVGIAGFGDFARDVLGLRSANEDLGQTLGYYGAGGGFYINWPFLGPSNFRDSLGMVGDAYLDPFIYLEIDWEVNAGARALEIVNYTALTMGDYELFIKTALDPYTAGKDAYQQYRNGRIKNQ